MSFVEEIARRLNVSADHLVVKYLVYKTKAADRGSKARRSLGNLYALYVLAEDYRDQCLSRYSDLLSRMKKRPFGEGLQNHPLDDRLNGEFSRRMKVTGDLLPIVAVEDGKQKFRTLSESLLRDCGAEPKVVALLIIEAVDEYIFRLKAIMKATLKTIAAIQTSEQLGAFFIKAFDKDSDARLFEIASYVLLAEFYRQKTVFIGDTPDTVKEESLTLFKTGRTNANDGGIDFVLQPSGMFFQVTENLNFKKYFLDFNKVNRYPISFVIKTKLSSRQAREAIVTKAKNSGEYSPREIKMYKALFKKIFTLIDLQAMAENLPDSVVGRVKREMKKHYKLEFRSPD